MASRENAYGEVARSQTVFDGADRVLSHAQRVLIAMENLRSATVGGPPGTSEKGVQCEPVPSGAFHQLEMTLDKIDTVLDQVESNIASVRAAIP